VRGFSSSSSEKYEEDPSAAAPAAAADGDGGDNEPEEEEGASQPQKKKKLSKLKRTALARRNGPDPYQNPTARKIVRWTEAQHEIAAAEQETRQWVKRVVVGLNLCPFAERSVKDDDHFKIRIVLRDPPEEEEAMRKEYEKDEDQSDDDPKNDNEKDDDNDADNIYNDTVVDICLQEMAKLVARNKGTTLVVCPHLYPDDFPRYLQIVDLVEQNLAAHGWEGVLQVAPFHPQFCFEGSLSPDAPDNFTNRAPHPTFHLLREDDVTWAVTTQLPNQDAAVVWSRNVDLLTELHGTLSKDDFEAVVRARDRSSDLQQRLRAVLQRYRVPLVRGGSGAAAVDDDDGTVDQKGQKDEP